MHGKQSGPAMAGIIALSTYTRSDGWARRGHHFPSRCSRWWREARRGYRKVAARIGCQIRRGRLAIRTHISALRWW